MDETDLRERLHETAGDPAARLDPHHAWDAARRRSGRRVVGIATAAAVVVAGAVGAASSWERTADPAPTTPAPSEEVERLHLVTWGDSLPPGPSPEIAYLAGTTVHLPGGAVTELDVDDAGLVGQTVAGLIVLVEDTDARNEFRSRYVLVHDDGTTYDMLTSASTPGAAQDALVSPDGRYFTNGATVIDKATELPVGEVPAAAQVLISWTPSGIVYSARGGRFFLWSPGGAPVPLAGDPGVYQGADHGIRPTDDGCADVVHIDAGGEVDRVGDRCFPDLLSVSPDGTRGLTTDLRVIDLTTGETTSITDPPLDHLDPFADVHWLNQTEVLVPVPASTDVPVDGDIVARLVRCDTADLTCESATGPLDAGELGTIQLP